MGTLSFIEKLGITDPTAITVISVSFMLFFGFLMTRVTKVFKLPNVTAYIVSGIIMGPFVLNLIPQKTIEGMSFIGDIALSFIAFGTGEYFKVDILKKNGQKVLPHFPIQYFPHMLGGGEKVWKLKNLELWIEGT